MPAVPRRRLLALAAATAGAYALSACQEARPKTLPASVGASRAGAPAKAQHGSAPGSSAGATVRFDTTGWSQAGIAAFNRSHPAVQLQAQRASASASRDTLVRFTVGAGGYRPFARLVGLSVALKTLNVRVDAYLPGVWRYWTERQRILGVPFSVAPWAVIWRQDAFAAAHLPPPAPDWSLSDFHDTCAALQALARSGRLKGLRAALGPMATEVPEGSSPFLLGALWSVGLWQGFVRGLGGAVAANGRFTLTAPDTVSAFRTLVDLAEQFSVPGKDAAALITTTSSGALQGLSKVDNLSAMRFSPYSPGIVLPAPYAWARLPRFPVEPVIPVTSTAMLFVAAGTASSPASGQALAAADFGTWLSTAPAIQALTTPPATAASGIQGAFWGGAVPSGGKVVGDWRNFRDAFEDFPVIPPHDFVVPALQEVLGQ